MGGDSRMYGVSWSTPDGATDDRAVIPREFADHLAMSMEWAAQKVGTVNPGVGEQLFADAAELRGYLGGRHGSR